MPETEKAAGIYEGEGGESEISPICPHLSRIQPKVFKSWHNSQICDDCEGEVTATQQRTRGKKKKKKKVAVKKSKTNSKDIWVCLSCGHLGCGRQSQKSHALHHSTALNHPLALKLSTGQCWCYVCDDFVPILPQAPFTPLYNIRNTILPHKKDEDAKLSEGSLAEDTMPVISVDGKSGVQGLQNFGNTCFFNATLQNLNQTLPLRDYLLSKAPGDEGPLTTSFRRWLRAMWQSQGRSSPRDLLGQVIRKAPQFRGGHQEDAHELLSYLLDGIQTEEKKRLKENNERNDTFLQQVFGGKLESTIHCFKCGHTSRVEEDFLNLSLPIPSNLSGKQKQNKNKTKKVVTEADVARMSKKERRNWKKQQEVRQRQLQRKLQKEKEEEEEEESNEEKRSYTFQLEDPRPPLEVSDSSISSCLYAFTDPEVLEDDNGVECINCTRRTRMGLDSPTIEENNYLKRAEYYCALHSIPWDEVVIDKKEPLEKSPATKQYLLKQLPLVLVLHLKRFRQGYGGFEKIGTKIHFPLTLDVNQVLSLSNDSVSTRYRLFGIIVHGGSYGGGHYVAYVLSKETDQWYYISDSHARATTQEDALSQQAYILFYQKLL